MHISIDTQVDLSSTDKAILRALVGEPVAKAAPAPKATPAKKTAAAKPAPAPEPEPEEEDEDLLGTSGQTVEDAVAKATAMVAEGNAKEVKAALDTIGVKKVSALTEDQVAAFFAELGD